MGMKSPSESLTYLKQNIKKEWKVAFLSAFLLGLLMHAPVMLRDIPNHDGLDSMHFSQNMIISGRWFLSVACGLSSYYTLPWLIGILAMVYLSLTSVVLVDLLEVKNKTRIILISALLVSFPAVASTFAYVFTMDGYMLGLLLIVLSVWFTKKKRLGFVYGAVCLALGLGIYQAYLPFAMLLCIYCLVMLIIDKGESKEKLHNALHYIYMGGFGTLLYYVILQILLKVQGTQIGDYQEGSSLGVTGSGHLFSGIKRMYVDFFTFSVKGNIFVNNIFSTVAVIFLLLVVTVLLIRMALSRGWIKRPEFYFILVGVVVAIPIATNIMLFIFPDLTYHSLMRYQWILFPIVLIGIADKYGKDAGIRVSCEWVILISSCVLIWNYFVTDQIAYANLEKKYEKTYAYCIRLLDRIEQTPGYYQGIPIAMIGVVGEESYPQTDITGDVTRSMIGINGDMLLYTGNNYELFIQHYLGATLNILPAESMEQMYYSQEYREMESFPGKDSIKIMDGIMYIKTENKE